MIKRVIAGALAFLWIFHSMLFFVFQLGLLIQHKYHLSKNHTQYIVQLNIPKNDPHFVQIEENEFHWNNMMYDAVAFEESESYWLITAKVDSEENFLLTSLDNQLDQNTDHQKTGKNHFSTIKESFYSQISFCFFTQSESILTMEPTYLVSPLVIPPSIPPPQEI